MTTQTAITSFPSRRRGLGAAAAGIVLVAAGLTAVGSPARAAPAIPDNCTVVQYGPTAHVECVVTDSGAITFTDLVPGTITPRDGDPVILTARGGHGGGNGWQGDVVPGHQPGRGGTTSVWAQGGGGWGGGAGGERNSGGGGGGSFARAATEHIDLPHDYASTPSVTIAWPAPYIG